MIPEMGSLLEEPLPPTASGRVSLGPWEGSSTGLFLGACSKGPDILFNWGV